MRAAIYARFSSDLQREASITDQARNCENFAVREGLHIVSRFSDQAMSGAKKDRPGYQAMLAAASGREFDVLLVDDLSRLSRDEIELKRTVRRFKFSGLRIVGVSDGFDSSAKGHKIQATVRGLLNEIYLDDLAEKTHRGLTGRAIAGMNTGGRSYGYRHIPVYDGMDEYGRPKVVAVRREPDPEQAAVVRTIFDLYVQGQSPRAITHHLNERGVKSPRGGTWCLSAIYGDKRGGVGILNNPTYAGRVIWNRSRWARDPDTDKRKRIERPESEWVVREDESLRIVSQEAWDAAQRRTKRRQTNKGKRGRMLLSGFMRCGVCGGPFVKVDHRYGCATNKDRGPAVCSNGMKVRVEVADRMLLDELRRGIDSPEAVELFRREVSALLRAEKRESDQDGLRARLAAVEREIQNMVGAIKAGAYSDALRASLEVSEGQRAALLSELESEGKLADLPDFLPRAADIYRDVLENLPAVLADDPAGARDHIRALLGDDIKLIPRPEIKAIEAVIPGAGILQLAAGMAAGVRLSGSGGVQPRNLTMPASGACGADYALKRADPRPEQRVTLHKAHIGVVRETGKLRFLHGGKPERRR